MRRILAFYLGFAVLLSGCSFNIKTPVVADYQRFDQIQIDATKNDVELLMGSPQGAGVHMLHGVDYPLAFYFGFAGVATLSTVCWDSGTAFITYDGEEPLDLLYFTSKLSGPEISMTAAFPIRKLIGNLALGDSNIQQVFKALGPPKYAGRRSDRRAGIMHNVALYDASQLANDGAMKERWILVGYDDSGIVQDLIWVSSVPTEIAELGTVSPQQMKQLSRLTVAGFLPILEPTSLKAGNRIDRVQVESLIRRRPRRIAEIRGVLGPPTAMGIKSFKGEAAMILSNWSFSHIEMKGREHNFVPPGASEEERKKLEEGESYMVMDVSQSRLMVGHDQEGNIGEILWIRPIGP